jgi:hypothetical protein
MALGVAVLLTPALANAHFTMDAPPQWIMQQDTLGDPQKISPCGVDSTVTYTPTNTVTAYAPGQTIMLQWTETIAHDGWFRIALSYKNRTDLVDPPYSANALGNSTDAGIENPPVAPVLFDGLFPHLAADITTPKTYTYPLTLPETPCAKCTLQIIQFMNNHAYNMPGGYFYHHCADLAIVEGADGSAGKPPTSSSGGASASSGGGSSGEGAGSSGSTGSGGSSGTQGMGASGSSSGSNGAGSGGASSGAGGPGISSSSSKGCSFTAGRASSTTVLGGLGGLIAIAAAWRARRRR